MLARTLPLFRYVRPPSKGLANTQIPRFFTTHEHSFIPHSKDYLALQQKILNEHGIAFSQTSLLKGTKLFGLNVNEVQPYFLGGAPLFKPDALNALSHNEKKAMLEFGDKYFAKMAQFKLLSDIDCLTRYSDNGNPIHFIHHGELAMEATFPLKSVLNSYTEYEEISRFQP